MEIKVREVDGNTEKSKAEIEEQLLKKHEESVKEETATNEPEKVETAVTQPETKENEVEESKTEETPPVEVEDKTQSSELNDEDVLSFLKKRYDKDINSVDELFETTESNPDLPEDVLKYFEFKKETGRGLEDFAKLQKDYESMDDDSILADYYSVQEEGLDAIDIQDILDDKFAYDEEVDEPKDVKRRKLAKKRELAKAKKFFNEQKDKYKIPLESSGGGLSEEQEKQLDAYKKYVEDSNTEQEASQKRREVFVDRTKNLFTADFKGFEYNVGDDKKITYKAGTSEELHNRQKDASQFFGKYMKDGGIENVAGYHRALMPAMDPDKFARFFFEQGVASAVENEARKSKNIKMDIRRAPQLSTKDGLKIRNVGDQSSGRGLKIRSIKKV